MKRQGPTPQPVVDAIQVIAAHLRECGFGSAVIGPGGGAVFRIDSILYELGNVYKMLLETRTAAFQEAIEAVEDVLNEHTGDGYGAAELKIVIAELHRRMEGEQE